MANRHLLRGLDFNDPEIGVHWQPEREENTLRGEGFSIKWFKGQHSNRTYSDEDFYKYEIYSKSGTLNFWVIVSIKDNIAFYHRLRRLHGKDSLLKVPQYFKLINEHLQSAGVKKAFSLVDRKGLGHVLERAGFESVPTPEHLEKTSANLYLKGRCPGCFPKPPTCYHRRL